MVRRDHVYQSSVWNFHGRGIYSLFQWHDNCRKNDPLYFYGFCICIVCIFYVVPVGSVSLFPNVEKTVILCTGNHHESHDRIFSINSFNLLYAGWNCLQRKPVLAFDAGKRFLCSRSDYTGACQKTITA